jgi:hypothetical protein
MKKLLLLLLSPLAVYAADLRTNLTLVCDYDPVKLSNTTIVFYSTTNLTLPLSNWTQFAAVYEGTSTPIPVFPHHRWFVARATNVTGVGDFSNTALQPVPPQSGVLLQLK